MQRSSRTIRKHFARVLRPVSPFIATEKRIIINGRKKKASVHYSRHFNRIRYHHCGTILLFNSSATMARSREAVTVPIFTTIPVQIVLRNNRREVGTKGTVFSFGILSLILKRPWRATHFAKKNSPTAS